MAPEFILLIILLPIALVVSYFLGKKYGERYDRLLGNAGKEDSLNEKND